MPFASLLTLAVMPCLIFALVVPFAQAQTAPVPPPEQKKQKSEPDTQKLRLRGRIQTGWEGEADNNTGAWSDHFIVRRARIDARWMPQEWVKLVLELELADQIGARDVYGEFDIFEQVALQVGRFKKPFSRLRMMSPWELLIPERGLLDQAAIDDTKFGGFGARDYGLMLTGAHEAPAWFPQLSADPLKWSWWLGGFNSLPNAPNYHRDLVGRSQLRLLKGLVLAIDGSLKGYEEASQFKTAALLGADLKWEWDPFRLQLEGAWGDNVNQGGKLWGAHATASWEVPLNEQWILTPALMVEVFDPQTSQVDDWDLRLAAALNLDIHAQIRLILALDKTWQDVTATQSALPDPLKMTLQTNLRF